MIPVAEARARILAACRPLPAETVALTDALGRVLAEPVTARLTQPPFAAAMMDGWAVRSADLASATPASPVALARAGEASAGHGFGGTLAPGHAVRIFTGAPLPDGADAVVMQEDCTADATTVRVPVSPRPGKFVRPAGLDFQEGEAVLPAGRRLTSRDVALTAAANVPWLRVHRRPRVAVLATGDEVRLPGEPLGPGQIVSSNAFGLCALVATQGGIASNLGVARDTAESLAGLAAAAEGFDLLATAGGASKGDYDHVRTVLGGGALDFDGVAMKPGKAVLFGRFGTGRLLGLPGNPVSGAVCAVLFLKPALQALQGMAPDTRRHVARLAAPLPACDSRADFVRATLAHTDAGEPVVTPFPKQDTAMTSRLARADALIVREPRSPPAEPGDRVDIIPLAEGCLNL
ncbi:gephyrin-like molybdotransferase Glp [Azospirillum sp. TSO22-1]|uniref:molybdopterin molybdotransferase MoeA n=1 Tax=Azospirillum sp. TSO22-1 TaxID=716789 RepID=UPI000D61F7C3|nr:gephyrin-like molybdotransferase Glp [Azospirillum sp. TSO22-1]PWC55822.1 molybdenum cofactor biosynthesis protein MoaA [Azospirillum sp. TSO22-1]